MEEKKEALQEDQVNNVSGGYEEGEIIHDYCPWCGCAAEGVFSKKGQKGIGGYQVEMKCGSCGKKFYHSYG